MTNAYLELTGAFGGGTASFAHHQSDLESAATYLRAAMHARLSWADAEADIREYLTGKKCTPDFIDKQVQIARPFLEPWLS
jgi:hypothetical protein